MRAVWTLIVCCLVAVGGVRPAPDARDLRALDRGAQLRDQQGDLPDAIAHRRGTANVDRRGDDHGSDPFGFGPAALATPPKLPPPPRAFAVASRAPDTDPHASFASSRSSRGPPIT